MKQSQLIILAIIFAIGAMMWMMPTPQGLTLQAWHLLVIFIFTIGSIIINVVPMSVASLLSIATCVVTNTLPLQEALSGFSLGIIWLVVLAFFLSRGFAKTGLGRRIAYYFISKIGHTTLGLSYGLILTELMLSPMIPSVTARSGGVMYPIAQSLVDEYGKETGAQKNLVTKTAAYIMQICFQSNVITCAMFLTALASNPLIVKLAGDLGVTITWGTWALGAIVPGLISLALLPLILMVFCRPGILRSDDAPRLASEALQLMGPLSRKEITMLLTFILLIGLWIFGGYIGMDTTTATLIGFLLLLLGGVLDWKDAIDEKGAWDTFIWFGTLVMLSTFLTKFGVMDWISGHLQKMMIGQSMIVMAVGLIAMYFYVHYVFASVTAHVTVLFMPFAMLLISSGMPAFIACMILAYASGLCACLTHYGNAAAPILYSPKYLTTAKWWQIGFIQSIMNIAVWGIGCAVWWRFLGWI
jgi:DASS family divalent anion:Na+ symporter